MMPDPVLQSIDADDPPLGLPEDLVMAAEYRRVVNASLTRIWENVFDWEHLPVLHDTYFNKVEMLSLHADGWTVKLTRQPGDPSRIQVLKLDADRAHTRYCVRTLEGSGAGTHIWTVLEALAPTRTAIRVRYFLPEKRDDRLAVLGDKYRSSCRQLWDEDEAMMMRRESLLASRGDRIARAPADVAPADVVPAVFAPVDLGLAAGLRTRLPLVVELGVGSFRIVEIEGELIAHSTTCPHWLGPLDHAEVVGGCVRCPWHGYTFDVRSGACTSGQPLRLDAAPAVAIEHATGRAWLVMADGR